MPRAKKWYPEPPPTQRSEYDWHKIVAELRTHPGEWTVAIPDAPASVTVAIKNKAMTALQITDGVVEGRRRGSYVHPETGKKHAVIWMRYVPNEEGVEG